MKRKNQKFDIEVLLDYESIRGKITDVLLPVDRCDSSRCLVQPLAGTTLGILYVVDLTEDSQNETDLIPITWKLIEEWGVSINDILQGAEDNRLSVRRPVVMALDALLREMGVMVDGSEYPMLVVTNDCRSYGAISITYSDVQEQIRDWFGGKDFYILPSSTHEVICVPADNTEPESLLSVVSDVNGTLKPGEYLARDVYRIEDGHLCSVINCSLEQLVQGGIVIPGVNEELIS